ncbi:MAG: ABC-type transport auxiliary lipoprotein family protein [Ignavibacteria bacterium]|nr:ABC-type transport auxiliary lipoprotein family protein [Ignavibacteria bacterium]
MKKRYFIALLFLFAGCVSIRTPFIPTQYYYLSQEPFSFRNIAEIETNIVFREFTVPEELFDNRLMIWYEDGTVQKLQYHRFNSDYSDLLNNFIFTRMNLAKAFKFGINKLNTANVPDYILEGNILEFKAYSEKKDKKKNWVQIALQVNLLKFNPMSTNQNSVFSKIYTQRYEVTEPEYSKFVQSFSKALSLLVDKIILDIQSTIAHQE